MLDKIFVDIYTDDKRQCIGAGDLKFISKSSKVWKKEEEGGKDRLCCCTEADKFTFYGKYKYVPLNKWMEISLKDGSIDMWVYRE